MAQDKSRKFTFKVLSHKASTSIWSPIDGGITAPKGFQASGINARLKASSKPDLALLLAPEDAICAGTFTQSSARANCIDLCQQRLDAMAGKIRAILINSGHANACVGEKGLIDSLRITKTVADSLNLLPDEVLICSTGVIGVRIPIESLLSGVPELVQNLSFNGGPMASQAILTTDLLAKEIAFEAELGGKTVRIGGMAKGSGMIHPNMATMLGYLTCDVGVPIASWQQILRRVVSKSFNAISVDAETSTNDAVLAICSGDYLPEHYLDALEEGLLLTAQHLAKAIARDGEGANCLIEISVVGAKSTQDARIIARSIASSSLVKSAIHGCDPNWGRIISAAGKVGISFKLKEISLWIGPYQLFDSGEPILFDKEVVSAYIRKKLNGDYLLEDCVSIKVQIGTQDYSAIAWGCDLSSEYVEINSKYTT